ncbi:hypothetical protein ACFL2C_00155 [Patescibacteria group bacterium]
MLRIFRYIYILLSITLLVYLVIPNIGFPEPPVNAVQSLEPADTETSLRRSYFTNFDRSDVLDHYTSKFAITIFGLAIPSFQLNYPPEEAFGLIRDQTRSTYLEEIVYPMRESIFINGFEPKNEKDDIWIDGVNYEQKITVRYYPSGIVTRLSVGAVLIFVSYIVIVALAKEIYNLVSLLSRKFI